MQIIENAFEAAKLGTAIQFENLQVFPLFSSLPPAENYLCLDEALAKGLARVTEVSEQGHVPELHFENLGIEAIFLLDGEELVGARQNRILNVSILVGGRRKIVVPVSCVEQGRWSYRSRTFSSAGRTLYARARSTTSQQVSRSMLRTGQRTSDQTALWASIHEKSASFGVRSDTLAMADVYEDRAEKLAEYGRAFAPAEGQVGAVFAVGGKVRGLELFDSATTFAKFLHKLVGSYALDAMEEHAPAVEPRPGGRDASKKDKHVTHEMVLSFLDEMQRAAAQRFAGVDEGEDVRLGSEKIAGGALVKGGRLIHLAAFSTAATS
jgi:hypothetical protein